MTEFILSCRYCGSENCTLVICKNDDRPMANLKCSACDNEEEVYGIR